MLIAWGFCRGPGKTFTGRRFQGTLLVQPHTSKAEHSPAGQALRPTGVGAELPLPYPPPVEGYTVASVWHPTDGIREAPVRLPSPQGSARIRSEFGGRFPGAPSPGGYAALFTPATLLHKTWARPGTCFIFRDLYGVGEDV